MKIFANQKHWTDSWGVNKLKIWCENYEMEKERNAHYLPFHMQDGLKSPKFY
jgi:hypothetical protein